MPEFRKQGDVCSFGNDAVALRWALEDEHLTHCSLVDCAGARVLPIVAPFALTFADGTTLGPAGMRVLAPLREDALAANPHASRLAERVAGRRVSVTLGDAQGRLATQWSVEQRDGARYLRMLLNVTALRQAEAIAVVSLLQARVVGAQTGSERKGTPVVAGNFYLGFELPLATSHVEAESVGFTLQRTLPLQKNRTLTYSAVAGVARDGQLRRDFATCLEQERARPYRPCLHYNSWWDIGYLTPYTQDQALERIETIGRELHTARGVQIDSFLFDDGWDDLGGGWHFSQAFAHGFVPLREAAARYGGAPGVWLSPWGGYCAPKDERITHGCAAGYEVIDNGLALSGPRYYERFHEVVMSLLAKDGVNQFKFDGTGNADRVFPGSLFDSDWDAAIQLIGDIRAAKPETFINLSTGTQPSPFWLRYADAIWRGGSDDGQAGSGTSRERWITYRDAQTYRNVVLRSPLFPLNSLMLHGIILAQCNPRLNTPAGDAFAHEVRSFFASGTQLQELYITPSLLGEDDWNVLAQAARWARASVDVLRDSHWIGGAPDEAAIYGWAAWAPHKAIVTLRNPHDQAQRFALALRHQLELPAAAAGRFHARSLWHAGTTGIPAILDADVPCEIQLAPFEVLTLELLPSDGG
ncbi:enterotoxin [Paraburkholderia sp. CNPSo 3281]|uniref:enterotoxin n=1 Tax=Paraburkholderia sp. CNPSo 3281 TaxID=2940933 RepID=UPI0020B70EDF|nr:enterotoxin [Paraburkholderia sp. CNPSo 3281]MCP3719261.1 enterotoxin [Paraburkholderia sp. CNPSo 3281]